MLRCNRSSNAYTHKLTISEVTLEIGLPTGLDAVGVLLGAVGGLHEGDGGNELGPNHAGDGGEGGEASGDVLGAGEADAGVGGEVTDDTEHGNAAVLSLKFDEFGDRIED